MPGSDGRVARNDAVEIGRITLRHDHGFAASGGASVEIGVLGGASVVRCDQSLGELGYAPDGDVIEIQAGLLIAEEAAVETRPFVAAVGGHYREAASQTGRVASRL